jgi:hypothetical protein
MADSSWLNVVQNNPCYEQQCINFTFTRGGGISDTIISSPLISQDGERLLSVNLMPGELKLYEYLFGGGWAQVVEHVGRTRFL